MKLLAVGTVAFDAIETPFGKTDKILGGAATYIGLAASVMKTDVSLVSVIGGDFPQHYLDMMTSKGINIDGVEMIKDGKTFFCNENRREFGFSNWWRFSTALLGYDDF